MSYDRHLGQRYGLWTRASFEEIDSVDMVQPTGGRELRHGSSADMVKDKETFVNFGMTSGRSDMRIRYTSFPSRHLRRVCEDLRHDEEPAPSVSHNIPGMSFLPNPP